MKRLALFLDRDGVINEDYGYVSSAVNFQFVDGIFELVVTANFFEYLVIIVTNQSGIARGYYSENDFHKLMIWVTDQFKFHSAVIDAIYFCPFHKDGFGKYKKNSKFRKPNPGMFFKAAKEHNINLMDSIMVGDNLSDMEAAFSAGIKNRFIYRKEHIDLNYKVKKINCLAEVGDFIKRKNSSFF